MKISRTACFAMVCLITPFAVAQSEANGSKEDIAQLLREAPKEWEKIRRVSQRNSPCRLVTEITSNYPKRLVDGQSGLVTIQSTDLRYFDPRHFVHDITLRRVGGNSTTQRRLTNPKYRATINESPLGQFSLESITPQTSAPSNCLTTCLSYYYMLPGGANSFAGIDLGELIMKPYVQLTAMEMSDSRVRLMIVGDAKHVENTSGIQSGLVLLNPNCYWRIEKAEVVVSRTFSGKTLDYHQSRESNYELCDNVAFPFPTSVKSTSSVSDGSPSGYSIDSRTASFTYSMDDLAVSKAECFVSNYGFPEPKIGAQQARSRWISWFVISGMVFVIGFFAIRRCKWSQANPQNELGSRAGPRPTRSA